ncbi:MAG: chromosome segregation protein SMC [Candidatus Aminicenantes bacterium]|nr:chromosome segregation protein SMC [Candidatus Aminicenantes bacterium]
MSGSIIKKLDIQGFKSFPERTRILFHPGITAIVGPNGTGKSNIVDALLWVLGGQRVRSLRGEKIDNIIFNGNAKKAPQSMADVTIALHDPVEDLVISHRVFRSGEGEYRLNGKAVRLKDIQDELWKRSIGEKEYFVIEQGTIGQFVTSKPNEKRLLLEEAAGTALYKDKKRQAENKLENSEQNLLRLEDIIDEVGRARNSLQRQAQAANRYRRLRERIRELTAFHFRRRLIQLERSQSEAFRQYNEFILREKEALTRLAVAEKDLVGKRKEAWDLEQALKKEQETLYELRSRAARFEAEAEAERKKLGFFDERRKRSRLDIEERRRDRALMDDEESEVSSLRESLESELARLRKDGDAAEERVREYRARLAGEAEELETLRGEHLALMARATELKNERARREKENELLLRQEEKLEEKLAAVRSRIEEQEAHLRSLDENIAERSARLRRLEEDAAAAAETLSSLRRESDALEAEWTEAREKFTQASIRLETLAKLLEARSGGPGPGPDAPERRRLVDLIEADAETSSLLDLLWKEESAAVIVDAGEFLSSLDSGRPEGLFLLQGPSRTEENNHPASGEPGVSGSLKSRVRLRPGANALLDRLRDAAVVDDLKTAVSLWLRHPEGAYLTADGSLLLPSGLLKTGRAEEGLFSLRREARDLEEEVGQLKNGLSALSVRLEDRKKEKEALEAAAADIAAERAETEKSLQAAERRKTILQADRDATDGESRLLLKELDILAAEKKELEPLLEEIRRDIAAREEEESRLRAEMQSRESGLGSVRREANQSEKGAFEIRAGLDVVKEKLEGLTRQSRSLSSRREATLSRLRAAEEDIKLCDEEESRVRDNILRLEEAAAAAERERAEQEAHVGREEAAHADLVKKRDEIEERVGLLRAEMETFKEERVKKEVAKAEIERDLVNLEETCWQELKKSLAEVKSDLPEEAVGGSEVEDELEQAKEDLQKYKAVNLMAEEEFRSHKERHDFLVKQRNDLRSSIADTKEAIHKIDDESRAMFLTALSKVNENFQQIFTLLFNGGAAEVKLSDPENPLESGVDIAAQPPGKKLQSLTLLSGGEKSLTSLAFLFALFRYKPTPFCLLDEVDAALDEVNLTRFLELMKKLKGETQFIIVTHNYKTMEVADFIYGTTMSEPNITNVLSVKLEKKDAGEKRNGA